MANQIKTRYIPVAKFDEYHPWPSVKSMRNRYQAAKNGTDPDFLNCIKKIGERVLVDERAFIEWLESHAESQTQVA